MNRSSRFWAGLVHACAVLGAMALVGCGDSSSNDGAGGSGGGSTASSNLDLLANQEIVITEDEAEVQYRAVLAPAP